MTDSTSFSIHDLAKKIETSQEFVIIPHKNPDGDAIGSALGLWHYLKLKGKKCTVIVNDAVPRFLHFLPGSEEIINFETDAEKCLSLIGVADFLICNDYSQLHRAGNLQPYIEQSTAFKVTIDHHPTPENVFDFYFHEVPASSTSELVYMLIDQLEPGYIFDVAGASCLYTGLLTDTGGFKHALRPGTFMTAAALLQSGISYEYIVSRVFDVNTPERLKLLGFALNERLVVLPEYRTAYISLSHADSVKLNISKEDTEGLVNYALSIENMVWAAFFHEREEGKTKLSFRSKGNFAVNEISGKYFGGGGHKNAAGGQYEATAEETLKKFLSILPEYKDSLLLTEIGKKG